MRMHTFTIFNEAFLYILYRKFLVQPKTFENIYKCIYLHIFFRTVIMISDEIKGMGSNYVRPTKEVNLPMEFYVYVNNVDEVYERAKNMGVTLKHPVHDQFYGDRVGSIIDPFGFEWTIATHCEDIPDDEIKRRSEEFMDQLAKPDTSDEYFRKKYLKYKLKCEHLMRENERLPQNI